LAPLQNTEIETLTQHLRSAVGPERWRVWFEGATDFHAGPNGLTVGVANLFISDYVQSHFSEHLSSAAAKAFGRALPIQYHVQADLFRKRREENLAQEAEASERLGAAPAPAPAGRPAQHAPAAETRSLFTLDSFIVGPCNQMAYAAARAAATSPGKDFHPLFIHGGCGLGKTHLLQGILSELTRARRRVACLSAEQFTNQYLLGMRTGRLDAFRHRYRQLDVLAIDDIHFLAGKPSTQDEFLHTFNEFDAAGRLVILASDSHPREIESVQDRLISRWVAGLVVRISRPDSATRRRIVHAKAFQMGRPLDDAVAGLLADRVQGSVRDLEGALTRVMAYAALLKHPLTLDLARQALADYVATAPARTSLEDIEQAVCGFFGVTPSDVHSARKSHQISIARQATMVLARDLTGMSYADIARCLGGKNHTTVLASCRKWEKLVRDAGEVQWMDRTGRRTMPAEALLTHLRERVAR
jgi:chromosomal replication initiator protein